MSQEKLCDAKKIECLQLAYKVARLDPHKSHTNKEVKHAFKTLSLFWHPDHYPRECVNATILSDQQMDYINDARLALERIGNKRS